MPDPSHNAHASSGHASSASMGFLGSVVIVVAMGMSAACLGALGFMLLRLPLDVAAILALATFCVMVFAQFITWRRKDRQQAAHNLSELTEAMQALGRDVAVLTNRMSAVEHSGAMAAQQGINQLQQHITRLDAGFDELTLALDEHAEQISKLHAPPPPALIVPERLDAAAPRRTGRFAHLGQAELIAMVAQAIEAGRIELMLQPIVTLPQRKVRWYEVVSRLKTEKGETLLPEDFQPAIELGGLAARFDSMVLFRAVQLLRRLQARNRDTGVIVTMQGGTLAEGDRLRELIEFLANNTALANALVLQIDQAAYAQSGPIEVEAMGAIARMGFKLALDHVRDLRVDARQLADRAFRFMKVPADVLLGQSGALPPDIHPADMAHLFLRYGIDIIADSVDAEAVVVDLLDYDIRFAQGYLFSPPRPVRAEIANEAIIPPQPRAVAS